MGELDQGEEVDSSPTPPSGEVGVLLGQLVALGERLDSLEFRVDAQAKGMRLELAALREDLRETLDLVRGLATAQGRLDTERENDRAALRDVSSAIGELTADIDSVSAEIQAFRSGRASGNFDAQALQRTIEQLAEQHRGDLAAIVAQRAKDVAAAGESLAAVEAQHSTALASIKADIGIAPDKVKGVEGSGALKAIAEINNARSIAVIAIGAFVGGGGAVAAILQLLGGK